MENPGEDESLFDQLPDHCLEHIFSFLSIRERLDIEEGILEDIERFPNLKEVFLRAVLIIPLNEMEIKEDSLKRLEKLDVLDCYVPQYNIPRLKTFLNLQELSLRIGVYNVADEDVRDIASHCHKIKKLSLLSFANMSPKCFEYLGKMPSLEVLTLQKFRKIKDFDILPLTNVKQLFLQKCGIINEDGFLKLIVNSTRLEKLQILKVGVTLCRRFLEGVGRIFHGGQREKHLSLVISVRGPIESCRTLQKKIEHPLLDLELSIQPPSIVGWGSDL